MAYRKKNPPNPPLNRCIDCGKPIPISRVRQLCKDCDVQKSSDSFDRAWNLVKEEDEFADVPAENKGGDCYGCAGRHLWSNPEHTLVHAMVTGQGPIEGIRYGHAFTTFTDPETGMEMVYDAVKDLTLPAALYYHLGQINPDEMTKYTLDEMNEMIQSSGHWGPWEEKTE